MKRDLPYDAYRTLELSIKNSTLQHFKEPHCDIAGNRKGTVIAFTSEKGVLQLSTMLSGKKEEEVKRYFRRSLKRRGKAKLIVNTDKNFSLIYKFNKGQLIIGFHFGVWNINGFPQHTWTKTFLLLIHVVPAVEGWLSCYVSTSCLRIKFLCPGENKWSRIVILISIDLGINHYWFIKRREKE